MEESSKRKGKIAQISGQFLEKTLENQFYKYKKLGLAFIDKFNGGDLIQKLESIYLKKVYSKKLRVDFLGYSKAFNHKKLNKNVFVGIEAKQTLKDYFSFNLIKPHQLNYLHNLYKANGIAFLIIGFPNRNVIIRWWVDDDAYTLINNTLSYKGTFSKGIIIDELIGKVTPYNIFNYGNPDILGLC